MDGHQDVSNISVKLGRVVSVAGAQIIVLLAKQTEPQNDAIAQIGSLVKMRTSLGFAYGIVVGLTIPVPSEGDEDEMQVAELTMIGETPIDRDGKLYAFRRGMSRAPALDDTVYSTGKQDLARVYAQPDVPTVTVGAIHQDKTLPAHILTDELLGKHFAILGTTGSGKSCAAALILRALLQKNSNAHVVMLDPHNEYASAFGDFGQVLNSDTLSLPYWLLNFDELNQILLGDNIENGDSNSAEASILHTLIPEAKRDYLDNPALGSHFTVDTPVPYKFSDLMKRLDDAMGRLERAEAVAPYRRLKARFMTLQSDVRFGFMFGGISVTDTMAEVLGSLFRIPVNGKPISIVDLSAVPSEILNVVVAVICRLTFDFALWSERSVPILLVCEEAHRYAPRVAEPGFALTKGILSRIAKEGRKYGVSLCVISQRPSRLSSDLLSQCNTTFALRLTNNDDQEHIRGSMADSSIGLIDFLPSLGNGEAIAVGQGVSLPVRLKFNTLPEEFRPYSATASFSKSWSMDSETLDFVHGIVQRWRRQG
jgi:DNA helicase HerA-like ATPase